MSNETIYITVNEEEVTLTAEEGMPRYVGATAKVERLTDDNGVKITLTDYNGTTEEVVYEAIEDITFNNDGTITFTLPDGRTFTGGSFKGPQGDPGPAGQDGSDGEDGVSPSVSVSTITGGHEVSITDASGTSTFNVMDGADGHDGQDGSAGADGYSPTATVTKSGDTATISITDKNGTTTATISDGTDGAAGQDGQDGEDGTGIVSIAKTGTSGLVDTYTITFTDGTTTTFTVTNGQNGSGSVADVLQNGVSVLDGDTAKVTVPTKVSDLTNDSGYITGYTETDPIFLASAAHGISASDITAWNGKSDFSGSYTDLTDKPTIPTKTSDLTNDSGFEANVQSDWNETNTSSDAYIANKPTIPSVTGKADKVSGATSGNFAGLDANGNLTDSGKKASDFVTDISGKADKATTLAGYGITDAKIENGVITLGGNTITPVTDISGKVDKVTGKGLSTEDFTTAEKAKLGSVNTESVIAQNVTSSAWSSDNTYANYPYRATLAVTGMTANHFPSVAFDGTDSDTEKVAPWSVSYSGGVYIYATEDVGAVVAQTVIGIKVV